MLKINLHGDTKGLEEGLEILSEKYQIIEDESGIPIKVKKNSTTDNLEINFDGTEGFIEFTTKNSFFRQLNLWLYNYNQGGNFSLEETAHFDKSGVMVDASRNAVLNIKGMKELLDYMAKLGLNQVMLYTEDTYEVKEYPYFGYLRGKYTRSELAEMDDYAHALGIEMVPCIQTLGHLYLALQYEYANAIKDTSDIVLVGEPKTYEFLERLIKAATEPFRSNRIHIGMDEAFGLGTGVYKQKNGIKDSFTIMNEHLAEVVSITDKYNLEPMMWSDMYYRFGSKTGDYYDLESEIPQDVIDKIPNVDMILWDYYHEDKNIYDTLINKHKAMNKKVIFAGGIWTWNGLAPNYGKTFETTKPGLASAKENGVKEVFATLWGDDGGETPILAALPGLQLFADLSYRNVVDEELMAEEFLHNTGYSFEKFLLLNELDETPGVMKNNLNSSATSKLLLWQDPLLGYYDKSVEGLNLGEHYGQLSQKLKKEMDTDRNLAKIFTFYQKLAEVLSKKSEFGVELKKAYDEEDKVKLREVLDKAKRLKASLNTLRLTHRDVWMEYNKAFGWEVLDIRYGGTIARMSTVIDRVSDYLDNKVNEIEELEEKKLPFSSPYDLGEGTFGRGLYKDMVTPGKLSGV